MMFYSQLKKTFLYWIFRAVRENITRIMSMDLLHKKCTFVNRGSYKIHKTIVGKGNMMIIGENSILDHVKIRIKGFNNSISIGKNCYLGKNCSIWLEGNHISVTIGDECSFTHDTQLCAQEDNSYIKIGNDCLFSHHINIRTSDSHLMYNILTGERVNYPSNVIIGNHVWIAPEVKVMKGCYIGDGSVIGSNAIVTKNIPHNSLAVGIPAKVVKYNISWKRDKLF